MLVRHAIESRISSYRLALDTGVCQRTLIKYSHKVGLKFHSGRFWSDEDLVTLKKLAETCTVAQAARKLGRRTDIVRKQADYRKIRFLPDTVRGHPKHKMELENESL